MSKGDGESTSHLQIRRLQHAPLAALRVPRPAQHTQGVRKVMHGAHVGPAVLRPRQMSLEVDVLVALADLRHEHNADDAAAPRVARLLEEQLRYAVAVRRQRAPGGFLRRGSRSGVLAPGKGSGSVSALTQNGLKA